MSDQRTHDLKTHPRLFAAMKSGIKTFDVRCDDRSFKEGDILRLVEWDGDQMRCLCHQEHCSIRGDILLRRVSYILPGGEYGVERGFVVLGLDDSDE